MRIRHRSLALFVALAGAGLASGQVPRQDSTGSMIDTTSHAPRRGIYLAPKGKRQCVVVDGKEGQPYDQIINLTISPDRKRVAYVGLMKGFLENKLWAVVDTVVRRHDDVILKSFVFSPDSRRVGYIAKNRGKYCIVMDGVEGKHYEGIAEDGIIFSPDSKRSAYTAYRDGKWYVVSDGVESRAMEYCGKYTPMFSNDGKHLGYVAIVRERALVVVDGEVVDHCEMDASLFRDALRKAFGPDTLVAATALPKPGSTGQTNGTGQADSLAAAAPVLTDEECLKAIEEGTKLKGDDPGLVLLDWGGGIANAIGGSSAQGFYIAVYTPSTWIKRQASFAAKAGKSFGMADVTRDMRRLVLRVWAYPNVPSNLKGVARVGASSVKSMELRSVNSTIIIEASHLQHFDVTARDPVHYLSEAYQGASGEFALSQLENVRAVSGTQEFCIAVIGDRNDKIFTIKTKHLRQLE